MANKYVSPYGVDGGGTNDGTGPTHDKAWLTLDYAIDQMNDSEVCYVAPGIYRGLVSPADTISAERKLLGDPMNTQGFTNTSDVLVAPGPCILTNLLTDDVSAATNTATFKTNGKDYITLENLWIESNSAQAAVTIETNSQNIILRNCYLQAAAGNCAEVTAVADTNSAITIERCILNTSGYGVSLTTTKTNNAEYDCGIVIRNCTILAGTGVYCTVTGTGSNYGGGITVQNCAILGYRGMTTASGFAGTLATYTINVKNSLLISSGTALNQTTASVTVIVEDWNFLVSGTPRANLAANGANTIAYGSNSFSRSFRHDLGQSQLFGFLPKSFMAPWSTSRTIGYGNDSTPAALTVDLLNRVRPSGSGVAAASVLLAVGAYELHDYGVKETTVKDAGDASIKLTGPGDHDIRVPVDASATVISIKARFDSATYGGANYPQAILLDAADIGVSTETKTATIAASDAWETLTFSSFTPTLKGWVVIRLLNRGSGADDICYFDTLAVT